MQLYLFVMVFLVGSEKRLANCLPKAPFVPRRAAPAALAPAGVSEFIALRTHRNSIMDFVVIVLIAAAIAAVGAATTLQPKFILRCFMSLI